LKISNTSPTFLYYAIGLEEKFENKWEELEPTLNYLDSGPRPKIGDLRDLV
jgi:hypothetical protein